MSAYYSEHDSTIALWLRELIKARLIADGEVDTRSIVDVRFDDLRGFVQCHFFAGIGGWSFAMRLAGWSDERPVWTGSCPCQPFSSAGVQAGGNDSRDLWPAWFKLLKECRPDVVFGEQVESAIGHGWLDRVCDDLEAEGYAVGAVDLPSACVGAFDKRQRLWFVADTDCRGCVEFGATRIRERRQGAGGDAATRARDLDGTQRHDVDRRGAINDRWSDAEWIACVDGRLRAIESGTRPLAHGIFGRVGRLRGYGAAINPWVAREVIGAYMELVSERM